MRAGLITAPRSRRQRSLVLPGGCRGVPSTGRGVTKLEVGSHPVVQTQPKGTRLPFPAGSASHPWCLSWQKVPLCPRGMGWVHPSHSSWTAGLHAGLHTPHGAVLLCVTAKASSPAEWDAVVLTRVSGVSGDEPSPHAREEQLTPHARSVPTPLHPPPGPSSRAAPYLCSPSLIYVLCNSPSREGRSQCLTVYLPGLSGNSAPLSQLRPLASPCCTPGSLGWKG